MAANLFRNQEKLRDKNQIERTSVIKALVLFPA